MSSYNMKRGSKVFDVMEHYTLYEQKHSHTYDRASERASACAHTYTLSPTSNFTFFVFVDVGGAVKRVNWTENDESQCIHRQ